MSDLTYTAITFAPVQGFIEKSRKLRDLYGSSFILSYLAEAICEAAKTYAVQNDRPLNPELSENAPVISPALINVTLGLPNQIIIEGEFPQHQAREAFEQAWRTLVLACQTWIEAHLEDFQYCWQREWNLWASHTWEFFWASGKTIGEARENLNEIKRQRDWTGVNWVGESSTLSGADGIAWPRMGEKRDPKKVPPEQRQANKAEIREFYQRLSQKLGDANFSERESLSILELVKRLITLPRFAKDLPPDVAKVLDLESPKSFSNLSRQREIYDGPELDADRSTWTGWFCGDGDQAGNYLKTLTHNANEAIELYKFSQTMRTWGDRFSRTVRNGRIIYAGGDDFLGVFTRIESELKPQECLDWFYRFKTRIWNHPNDPEPKPITASVGFVWAAPNVPQRDVLQQCREAEQSAKANGRDRIALRILFNGGNYLEWCCPWRFLPVLEDYRDRNPQTPTQNWTHFYNDVDTLQSRHAFEGKQVEVAVRLFQIYFDPSGIDNPYWQADDRQILYNVLQADSVNPEQEGWWNLYEGDNPHDTRQKRIATGILGDRKNYLDSNGKFNQAGFYRDVNQWIINLAKVGFHLCS
jgi:CRISPR-associated protein Cmr2